MPKIDCNTPQGPDTPKALALGGRKYVRGKSRESLQRLNSVDSLGRFKVIFKSVFSL